MNSRPGDYSHKDDDCAYDHNGNPLVDRFGRPVRRRSNLPRPQSSTSHPDQSRAGIRRSSTSSPNSNSTGRHRRPSAQPQPPQYRRTIAPGSSAHSGYQDYSNAAYPAGDYPPDRYAARSSRNSAYSSQGYGDNQDYRDREHAPRAGYDQRLSASQYGRDGQRWRRPQAKNTSFKRRRFPLFKTLGAILLVLCALVIGTGIWVDTSLNRTDALTTYDGRPGNTKGTNWLLVGSDSRAGLSEADAERLSAGEINDSAGRTDTIMVVNIPTFGGKPKIISFPRDSYVNIPGHGMNKINAAFSLGGPQLLQKTIEQATGWRIDHYAEIGFGGFASLVDSVGGITMCLDQPLQDPMAGINLQAGCQKMNGVTALGYVRSRYTSAGGDLDRARRQREFVSALSKKIASPGTLLNPFTFFPVVKGMTGSLTVDKGTHVWNLTRLGLAIAGGTEQVEIPVAGYQDLDVGNVVMWDEQGAEQLFASLR
ncbi:LytR family transcriptional regulator [Corynebacterium sp. 4HC-13]|uniref:LCP family protein n=1 Tax=Corynebacterium anserum TaxID=2684406 RepID=UPI00163A7F22|nr:LCP family protein [Corynebacterium anserum]MBC2681462.1 LytR family transcriptional regulator [Corynebacterium anserum]